MTKQQLLRYIDQIKAGDTSSPTKMVIHVLLQQQTVRATVLQDLSGATPSKVHSILKVLQNIGCVVKMRKDYTWVADNEQWPIYAKIYRKQLAIGRIQRAIIQHANDYEKGYAIRSQLEIETMEDQITELMELLTNQV